MRKAPGLLVGYLPLVVVGALLVAMVWVVPSEVPEGVDAATGRGTAIEVGETGTTASGWEDQVQPCQDTDMQDPDRDYSPPCFEFEGDNGGETAVGVTEDTVRVSYRHMVGSSHFLQTLSQLAGQDMGEDAEHLWRTADGLVDYFNEHYEFYGRQIELVRFDGNGDLLGELQGAGQENANVDAREAEDREVFADVTGYSQPYAEQLIDRNIVTIGAPYMSREWFSERSPYAWSPFPDCTYVAEIAADVIADRILGQPANMAGGSLNGRTRKLGVVYPNNDEYQRCGEVFQDLIREAGHDIPEPQTYAMDFGNSDASATSILARLQSDGITTVGFAGDPMMLNSLARQAEQQGYTPEWVLAGVGFVDLDLVGQMIAASSGDQWSRAFGVSSTVAPAPFEEGQAYQAFKSARPDEEPTKAVDFIYGLIARLAIGIQMAGPDLTPETFAAGMYQFPESEGFLGTLNFEPDNVAGLVDARLIYWVPDAASGFNGSPGTWGDTNERFRDVTEAPTEEDLLERMEALG